jgi:hypothetical protein
MDARLIVLKLTLDTLEIPIIPANQLLCSGSIFLAQTFAADLGYHFHYANGQPRADQLARDFLDTYCEIHSGDRSHYRHALRPTITQAFATLRSLIEPPTTLPLTRPDWIDLLSTTHFLTATSRLSAADIHAVVDHKWDMQAQRCGVTRLIEIDTQLPAARLTTTSRLPTSLHLRTR